MIAVLVKVIAHIVRLGIVQPDHIHAQIEIVSADDVIDIFTGFGVGRVDLRAVALIVISLHTSSFRTDEKASLFHLCKMGAALVNRRPYRDAYLDAHLMKLINHGFGIRPVVFVKAPFPLVRPMEEVDDDDIDVHAFCPAFMRNFQNFFLGAVAQFALP